MGKVPENSKISYSENMNSFSFFVSIILCFHFHSIFWTLWCSFHSALHINCFTDQTSSLRHMSKESKSWLLLTEMTMFSVCLPTNSTPDIQRYKQRRSVQNNLVKASHCSHCIPNAIVAPNWKHERWGTFHYPLVALQVLITSEGS